MLGIVLLHEVSKKSVGFKSTFCFKITMINNSENDIENVNITNFTTVNFEENHYTFEKNVDFMEVFMENNVVIIPKFYAKSKIVIYINTCVSKIFNNSLVSFARADYKENNSLFKTIRSNESYVGFIGSDFTGDGFKVSVSKSFIDYDEIFDVSIDICNKGSSIAKDVSVFDFISQGCSFVAKSLFINGTKIDAKEDISVINLSDIMPFNRMKIYFKIRAINCKEKFMQGASLLYHDDIDNKGAIREDAAKIKMIIRKIKISNFIKETNKSEFKLDEKINFKVSLVNKGNVGLLNLKLNGFLSENIELCKDSFLLNNEKINFEGNEVQISYLNEAEEINIEYSGIAKKTDKNIKNICNLSYKYLSSDGEDIIENQISSEQNYYSILGSDLQIDKFVDKNTAFIGDEVLFNISLYNNGNISAKNIKILDEVFDGFNIISDIEIDNTKINLENGCIYIDEIEAKTTKNIRYLARANNIVDKIQSYKVKVDYESFVDGEACKENKIGIYYGIHVKGAIIDENCIERIFDSECVSIFDEIRITSFICNKGNLSAKKVSLREIIGNGFSFVGGSLYINGNRSFLDISSGIIIGDLDVGEEVKLEYRLLAEKIIFDKTTTQIKVSYLSQKDKSSYQRHYTKKSNEIFVSCAYIGQDIGIFEKSAKSQCCVLDETEVRMLLKNTGNIDAFNVLIEDFLDEDMKICSDIFIKGKKIKEASYINLERLKSGESIEIYYKAKILETQKRKIKTYANVTYNYYIDSIQKINQGSGRSNKFYIDVFDARINMMDNISSIFSNDSEQIVYNLYINNIGNVDIDKAMVKIKIDDDVEVNVLECTLNGEMLDINSLNESIDIKQLKEAQTSIISLRFIAKSKRGITKTYISTNFEGEYIGCEEKYIIKEELSKKEFFLSDDSLVIEKTCKKKIYLSCDDVEYVICIKNIGTSSATNLAIYDDDFEKIVNGNLKVNGVDFFLEQGFINIKILEPSTSVFITYSCRYKVLKETFIKPRLFVRADFFNDFLKKTKTFNGDFQGIKVVLAELSIINTVNKKQISYGEKVSINSTIINKGSIPIYDLYLEDIYSEDFRCLEIDKDVEVRGDKLYIPFLKDNDMISVKKEYLYESYKSEDKIEFKSIGTFIVNLEEEKRQGNKQSEILLLNCRNDISKAIDVEAILTINDYSIAEIVDVKAKIYIDDYYFIKTIKSKIYKNNILTGKKMILRGHIDIKVEYIEDDLNEQIRIAKKTQYFSQSIIVIEKIEEMNIDVKGEICDVFYRQLDSKRVLTSSSVFIDIIV